MLRRTLMRVRDYIEDFVDSVLNRYVSTKALDEMLFGVGTTVVFCVFAFMIGMVLINDVNRMYQIGTALIVGAIVIGAVSAWLWNIVHLHSCWRAAIKKYHCRC